MTSAQEKGPARKCRHCGGKHPKVAKQYRLLVEHFASNRNGAAAAEHAGFSKRRARQTACDVLKRPEVACMLTQIDAKRNARVELDGDWVLKRLMNISDLDPSQIFNDDGSMKKLSEIPEDIRKTINAVKFTESKDGSTIEVKIVDKGKTLEMLGRNQKLFTDITRLEGDLDIRAQLAQGRKRVRREQ